MLNIPNNNIFSNRADCRNKKSLCVEHKSHKFDDHFLSIRLTVQTRLGTTLQKRCRIPLNQQRTVNLGGHVTIHNFEIDSLQKSPTKRRSRVIHSLAEPCEKRYIKVARWANLGPWMYFFFGFRGALSWTFLWSFKVHQYQSCIL